MGDINKLMPFSSESKNIKYVAVEVIKKDTVEKNLTAIKTSDITFGLFSGLRVEKDNSLIYINKISEEDKSLIGLSLDSYNIMRIEIAHGNFKEELFYQKYNPDQMSSKEALEDLMTILPVKEGTSFVEINKYDTTSLKDEPPTKTNSNIHNSVDGIGNRNDHNGWTGYGPGHCGNNYNSGYVYNKPTTLTEAEKKKLIKPCPFRRKGIKPSAEDLANMLERVRQIKNNTYVQPEFIETKVVDGKEWESKSTSTVDDMYSECFYC